MINVRREILHSDCVKCQLLNSCNRLIIEQFIDTIAPNFAPRAPRGKRGTMTSCLKLFILSICSVTADSIIIINGAHCNNILCK